MLKLFILLLYISKCTSLEYTGRFDNYKNHTCIRDCNKDSNPHVCEYDFILETYSTLSRACYNCPENYTDCLRENCILGDGTIKQVESVNRMIPGPAIHVCKGDTIIVNVVNNLRSERVTSIHWHGLRQKNSPYMDGVGMVTQCPIIPHTTFRYEFVANDPGSYFWHAHSGVQRAAGIYGALIIRDKDDPHKELYDFDLNEHSIILVESNQLPLINNYGPYMHSGNFGTINTILINGKGQLTDKPNSYVPMETLYVKKGFRYRFRVINNAIENCMMEFSIDGHNLTIISSDGQPIEPIEVESFASNSGERYDFVLHANNNEYDYWIKIKGEGACSYEKVSQRAILRYERDDYTMSLNSTIPFTYEQSSRSGLQLRTIPPIKVNQTFILFDKLKHYKNYNSEYYKRLSEKPDKKIYLNMDLASLNDPEFHQQDLYPLKSSLNSWKTSVINDIRFELPSIPPLLDWENMSKDKLCNDNYRPKNCKDKKFCACVHLLEFDLNDLVEFIFIDGANMFEIHSTHLHGHNFAVLGIEAFFDKWNGTKLSTDYVKNLDDKNLLKRNFDRSPLKDSITMPTGGYAIVRFIADNPGFWMLHCHLDSHADSGMMILIKVGEPKQFPSIPENFPTCGRNSKNFISNKAFSLSIKTSIYHFINLNFILVLFYLN